MQEGLVTKAELLETWRDAVRAAELAERLAANAAEAAQHADLRSEVSAELADLAEQAAETAQRAAQRARAVAAEAAQLATTMHEESVPKADDTYAAARELEATARSAYHSDAGERSGPRTDAHVSGSNRR